MRIQNRRTIVVTGLLLLMFGAAACTGVRQEPAESPAMQAKSAVDESLRPGDVVRLRIWLEPDLSGDFPVDQFGTVVLPKIGPMRVTDTSPAALRDEILSSYGRYLRNPSIDIMLLRRVNILGAVRNPGLYPVDPTMTVADALALAGGTLWNGEQEEVELLRDGERIRAKVTQRTRITDLGMRSGDQLFVPERSWIARNSGIIATTISASVALIIALINLYANDGN